jgi:succinyl-diaminopimelate desuccinylase
MAETLERLRAAVAARRDELVALTQDLIRVPTLNPPGAEYRAICEMLAARLAGAGFATQLLRAEGTPGDSDRHPRWNLVARREGRGPGPAVHFNGHIDVVEVGHGWTVDPFGGELRAGRIYGRGACDMKGGIAAAVVAVEAFLELWPGYRGAIEVSATADEETGGYGGVAWLAERGHFARVDHVIIPEPLNKDRVCLGHRGVWWAELETFGRIAHGSMPFLGDCAVRHMGAVIAEMEASLWPVLAARRTAMPVVPEAARASTLNINSLHGGQDERPADFTGWPVAGGARQLPDDRRPPLPRRGGDRRGEGGVPGGGGTGARPAQFPLRDPRHARGSSHDDRARCAGRGGGGRGGRAGAGPAAGIRGLAGHLRPEAHRPDRAAEELHRLRARNTGPRAPT